MGEAVDHEAPAGVDDLRADCARSNGQLLTCLATEDEHATVLLELAREDARLGRMTPPVPVQEMDLDEYRMCPRFAVLL